MPGWITAFRALPWTQLIAAAPVVASGARKLWNSVKHQEAESADGQGTDARLQALEAQIEELRAELTAAAGFTATLAEQNALLVEAIAVLRVRTRVLLIFCGVLAAALVAFALMN